MVLQMFLMIEKHFLMKNFYSYLKQLMMMMLDAILVKENILFLFLLNKKNKLEQLNYISSLTSTLVYPNTIKKKILKISSITYLFRPHFFNIQLSYLIDKTNQSLFLISTRLSFYISKQYTMCTSYSCRIIHYFIFSPNFFN